jgi:FtsH-binding integral membrane protein
MNFGKLIMWIGNAFFWGVGIAIAGTLVNSILFEKIDNIWIRLLAITILGGITMHYYNDINEKEAYKKAYKDIIK